MDYEYMHKCFPFYTLRMWQGKEPSNKNYAQHISGSPIQRWEWEHGVAETYYTDHGYEVLMADVPFSNKFHIFICNDYLELFYNGGPELYSYWRWSNKDNGSLYCHRYKHEVSEAEVRRQLSKGDKIPNSLIWNLVKDKMWKLFEQTEYKGNWRDSKII